MNLEKISEFLSRLEERFGVYLDATQGFILNYTRLLESQQLVLSQHGIPLNNKIKLSLYGKMDAHLLLPRRAKFHQATLRRQEK